MNRRRHSAKVLFDDDGGGGGGGLESTDTKDAIRDDSAGGASGAGGAVPTPRVFSLSVPVKGMEELVVNVGGCSGAEVDKLDGESLPDLKPFYVFAEARERAVAAAQERRRAKAQRKGKKGGTSHGSGFGTSGSSGGGADGGGPSNSMQRRLDEPPARPPPAASPLELAADQLLGFRGCAAFIAAEVVSTSILPPAVGTKRKANGGAAASTAAAAAAAAAAGSGEAEAEKAGHAASGQPGTGGHHLIVCKMVSAVVRKDYWSGKTFAPQSPDLPPYLSFLGSKEFAYCRTS